MGEPTKSATPYSIEMAGLGYAYPGGRRALADVAFTTAAGENVGLVGPNGAGKTTLFLCLAGVLPVAAGHVRVCGLDPAVPAERRQLPSRVGGVFQNRDDR